MIIKTTGNKTDAVKKIIFEILDVLSAANINFDDMTDRRKEKVACACLAVAGVKTSLKEARSMMSGIYLRTRDIIAFENDNYGENIAMGSYDDIRRKDLKPLIDMGYVVNSADFDMSATNNPTRGYALSAPFCKLIQSYGTKAWTSTHSMFVDTQHKLREELRLKRSSEMVPVTLPSGVNLELSAGEHNVIQKKIIESFLPTFGMDAQVLYIGDTNNKHLYQDNETLKSLNFFNLEHDELPDIVAYSKDKNLLFLIEAVHSSGPMSESRITDLRLKLNCCSAKIVFITAFNTMNDFKKWLTSIAWETEVWICDIPNHLVHFNGNKFLEINK